jgi:hypothetical protein
MTRSPRLSALALAAGLAAVTATAGTAHALPPRPVSGGVFYRPYPSIPYGAMAQAARVNPNYMIAPGLNIRQYGYNVSALGAAYSTVPPYLLGYPYPYPPSYGFPPAARVQIGSPYVPYISSGGYGGYGLSGYGGYYGTGSGAAAYNPYYSP